MIDPARRRQARLRNLVQSGVLLTGMLGLLGLCGWIMAGREGVLWAIALGFVGMLLGRQVSPRLVLRLFGAIRIPPSELPDLHRIVVELSRRAGLEARPEVYYVPSPMLNAFTVGGRGEAAIAITDGMLRRLSVRELAGVIAHEISHVTNNDMWVMGLADSVTRLTRIMSFLGVMLLFLNLPLLLMQEAQVPWILVLLLMLSPTLASLLQLALSRTREYEADLAAAEITGDPVGLASALDKLERHQGRFWESVTMPGQRMPDPSLLRTHPRSEDRIRRLLELRPERRELPGLYGTRVEMPRRFDSMSGRRRTAAFWF